MYTTKNDSRFDTACLALLAGTGIGIGIGLMLAPKAGHELRREIGDVTNSSLDHVKTQVKQHVAEVQSTARNLVETGIDKVQKQKEHLTEAFAAGQRAYMEKV